MTMIVRAVSLLLSSLAFLISSAHAQEWGEYIHSGEHLAINFPGTPNISEGAYMFSTGESFPAVTFSAADGSGQYSVIVVHYAGAEDALRSDLIALSAATLRARGGAVTYDGVANYDGMDAHMLQIDNPDGTRSYIAIMQPPESSGFERLYIAEGRVAANAPVPGHFQQSLSAVDAAGERIRYNTDIEGTKFRVVPGTGGEPLLREECAPGLPCPTTP